MRFLRNVYQGCLAISIAGCIGAAASAQTQPPAPQSPPPKPAQETASHQSQHAAKPPMKSTAIFCTPSDGTKPFTLLADDKGVPTSVEGGVQALVGHQYPHGMPLERYLALEKDGEAKGFSHMLRIPGPGPNPTYDRYFVVFSNNEYSEGVFVFGPQNPQRLILTSTGGKCVSSRR